MNLWAGIAVGAALSVADPVCGQTFDASRVAVSDGDTLKFGHQLVRLFGIDAPERGQTCDDGQWRPGSPAKQALTDFIGSRPVICHQVDYDRKNSRPVAICFAA